MGLIPAQYVKPDAKRNRSDYIDAEAIAEAVSRPTMRFVPIKTDRHPRTLNPHSHARDGRFDGRSYMANSGIRDRRFLPNHNRNDRRVETVRADCLR